MDSSSGPSSAGSSGSPGRSDNSPETDARSKQVTYKPVTSLGKRKPESFIASRSVKKHRLSEEEIKSQSRSMAERYLKSRNLQASNLVSAWLTSLMQTILREEYSQALSKAKEMNKVLGSLLPESELKLIRRACDYLDNPNISASEMHYKLAFMEFFLVSLNYSPFGHESPLVQARDDLLAFCNTWVSNEHDQMLASVCLKISRAIAEHKIDSRWCQPEEFLRSHGFDSGKPDIKALRGHITRLLQNQKYSDEALLQAIAIVESVRQQITLQIQNDESTTVQPMFHLHNLWIVFGYM